MLPRWNELNLRGTFVTDQCIETLIAMKSLERVWLGGTNVSDLGIEPLRQALPIIVTDRED